MAKLNGKSETGKNPEDLVQTFAAAGNFPKEREGVLALAQALRRASDNFGIMMEAIVQECADTSAWCPTPADLRNIAMSMRDAIRNRKQRSRHAEWERIYGPADPDWSAKLIGVLVGASYPEQKAATRERAIRDMLFYTEGDGVDFGDREFWREARERDITNHSELVDSIRERGGWRTERELQS